VPGRGHSSPIVVGDRVFLTTADMQVKSQSVLAFDRRTGRQLWQQEISRGGFPARNHPENTEATPTIACDGERPTPALDPYDPAHMDLKPKLARVTGEAHSGPYAEGNALSPTATLQPLDTAQVTRQGWPPIRAVAPGGAHLPARDALAEAGKKRRHAGHPHVVVARQNLDGVVRVDTRFAGQRLGCVPQHKRDLLLPAQVRQPVPRKQALARHREPLAIRLDELQKPPRSSRQIHMLPSPTVRRDHAHVHGSCVQINATVERMRRLIEPHHRSPGRRSG